MCRFVSSPETAPLESPAVALDREAGEVDEELAARTLPAPLRLDEQILEVNAVLADERRKL